MKKSRLNLILLFISTIFLSMCSGDDFVEDIDVKFCGEGCSSSTPWRVESLDLNLPCFSTKDACLEWAASNGYRDKPCIKCD
ncbi:MAG: hypothetical protein R6W85_01430 [Gillisia sp.]